MKRYLERKHLLRQPTLDLDQIRTDMNTAPPFTAHYNPDTKQVRVACALGELVCANAISLETYGRRVAAWPSLYPANLLIRKA